MKKLLCLTALMMCIWTGAQAQTSRRSSLKAGSMSQYGLLDGSRQSTNRLQSQQTNPYQQSRDAVKNSGFSVENSYYTAPKTETVRNKDGSVFHGRTLNGVPIDGVIEDADGIKIHCGFENGRISGLCLTEYPDGSWYVGMWKDGKMHGEGTYYNSNNRTYLEMKNDHGTIVSANATENPKYTKEAYLELQQKKAQILLDGLNELNDNSSSTKNSPSRRSSSSTSRMCGVCNGSGKCRTCNGRGYFTAIGIGSGQHLCASCNHTGRCRSCNGTGKT